MFPKFQKFVKLPSHCVWSGMLKKVQLLSETFLFQYEYLLIIPQSEDLRVISLVLWEKAPEINCFTKNMVDQQGCAISNNLDYVIAFFPSMNK